MEWSACRPRDTKEWGLPLGVESETGKGVSLRPSRRNQPYSYLNFRLLSSRSVRGCISLF